jgi:hypothetical protein
MGEVVMYVDLLTRALGTGEAGSKSNDLLLADLVDSRARLRDVNGGSTSSAAESLARELSYDGALIRMCEALAVPASPSRFGNPPQERQRLELELAALGLPLIESAASTSTALF